MFLSGYCPVGGPSAVFWRRYAAAKTHSLAVRFVGTKGRRALCLVRMQAMHSFERSLSLSILQLFFPISWIIRMRQVSSRLSADGGSEIS